MAVLNISPGILRECTVIENTTGKQSENEELESPASDYLFPAFLLFPMEFVKHYWSLELRAKLYNNIEQLCSGAKCQAVLVLLTAVHAVLPRQPHRCTGMLASP